MYLVIRTIDWCWNPVIRRYQLAMIDKLKLRTEVTIFVVILAPAASDDATVLRDTFIFRATIHISVVLLFTFQFHIFK